MLFDTDVLIWFLRGNAKAGRLIETQNERFLSVVSYMEMLQGARDRREIKLIREFLRDFSWRMVPLTENISHRASIYMEEYVLKTSICLADALIAATATENQQTLCTANRKHYKPIDDLELKIFRP